MAIFYHIKLDASHAGLCRFVCCLHFVDLRLFGLKFLANSKSLKYHYSEPETIFASRIFHCRYLANVDTANKSRGSNSMWLIVRCLHFDSHYNFVFLFLIHIIIRGIMMMWCFGTLPWAMSLTSESTHLATASETHYLCYCFVILANHVSNLKCAQVTQTYWIQQPNVRSNLSQNANREYKIGTQNTKPRFWSSKCCLTK